MLPNRLISILLFASWYAGADAAHAQFQYEAFTEPFRTVELSPAESGLLGKLYVEEGDIVRAGDTVAMLDTRVVEVNLKIAQQAMQSKGKLRAATAEYNLRVQRLEKLQELKLQGFARPDELERAAADVEVAEANRLAAEEQLKIDTLQFEKAQAELELRTIRSPINGVVVKVHHEEQEFVAPPNSVVLVVVQLDPLRIVFPLPTAVAQKLRKNKPLTVHFPDTNQVASAQIELVSPITDAESGLVRVKVLVANPEGHFRAGVRALLNPEIPVAQATPPSR